MAVRPLLIPFSEMGCMATKLLVNTLFTVEQTLRYPACLTNHIVCLIYHNRSDSQTVLVFHRILRNR